MEAEVYESLYSDSGLNVWDLQFFQLHKDIGSGRNWWSSRRSCQKQACMAHPLDLIEKAHIFYEHIGYEEIKRKRFLKIIIKIGKGLSFDYLMRSTIRIY